MSAVICVSKTYKIIKYELLTHIIIKCVGDEKLFSRKYCAITYALLTHTYSCISKMLYELLTHMKKHE